MARLLLLLTVGAASVHAGDSSVQRNVVYGMYSGLALLLDVYVPDKPNGFGVVFISGSGWSRSLSLDAVALKESGQEKLYAVPLAQAGYTVFAINHRAAPRYRHPDHLNDAKRAVRFMRFHAQRYGIDHRRIGAMGGSSGGHLVALLGTMDDSGDRGATIDERSARVQAVVARAAPTDLTLFGTRPLALFGFGDSSDSDSEEHLQFLAASPIAHVTGDDAPTLLLHGDKDTVVDYKHSEVMLDALIKAGVEANLIRIPNAGHGPHFPGATQPPDYIGAMIDWFDTHLTKP